MICGHRWAFVYAACGMAGALLGGSPLWAIPGMMIGLVIGDIIDHARVR